MRAMRRCAFLTHRGSAAATSDDRLAVGELQSRGWRIDPVPWRSRGVPWQVYDAVVIRSTWDYHRHPHEFLERLAEIDSAGVRLFNPLAVVRWNADKTYLRDLASRGVPTVPTIWRDRLEPGGLGGLFEALSAVDIVVKPLVGASAEGTERIDRHALADRRHEIEARFAAQPLMAQPFARAVIDEGEYSLIYLDGTFSHAVRKTPRAGDYRVQEEHGGAAGSVEAEPSLRAAGDATLAALEEPPLYARVDIVRSNDRTGWWLMELELIEPNLYLGRHSAAPQRFARALDHRMAGESVARTIEHADETQ
jgi:glutathione synthase/RimK-type ligase-like ATP-grasp enzyme